MPPHLKGPETKIITANLGTGFFIAETGDIITARHVVRACEQLTVSGTGFRMRPATVAAVDPYYDIALLRTEIVPPASLPINYDNWDGSLDTLEAALERSGAGQGKIIGFHPIALAPETDIVELPRHLITRDHRHFYRVATGHFISGESGSPILISSGQVVGVLFEGVTNATMKWVRFTHDKTTGTAIEDNMVLLVPGPNVRQFALSEGVRLTTIVPAQPAQAVVRITCTTSIVSH